MGRECDVISFRKTEGVSAEDQIKESRRIHAGVIFFFVGGNGGFFGGRRWGQRWWGCAARCERRAVGGRLGGKLGRPLSGRGGQGGGGAVPTSWVGLVADKSTRKWVWRNRRASHPKRADPVAVGCDSRTPLRHPPCSPACCLAPHSRLVDSPPRRPGPVAGASSWPCALPIGPESGLFIRFRRWCARRRCLSRVAARAAFPPGDAAQNHPPKPTKCNKTPTRTKKHLAVMTSQLHCSSNI